MAFMTALKLENDNLIPYQGFQNGGDLKILGNSNINCKTYTRYYLVADEEPKKGLTCVKGAIAFFNSLKGVFVKRDWDILH